MKQFKELLNEASISKNIKYVMTYGKLSLNRNGNKKLITLSRSKPTRNGTMFEIYLSRKTENVVGASYSEAGETEYYVVDNNGDIFEHFKSTNGSEEIGYYFDSLSDGYFPHSKVCNSIKDIERIASKPSEGLSTAYYEIDLDLNHIDALDEFHKVKGTHAIWADEQTNASIDSLVSDIAQPLFDAIENQPNISSSFDYYDMEDAIKDIMAREENDVSDAIVDWYIELGGLYSDVESLVGDLLYYDKEEGVNIVIGGYYRKGDELEETTVVMLELTEMDTRQVLIDETFNAHEFDNMSAKNMAREMKLSDTEGRALAHCLKTDY